jgi:outer membrane protein assembly factor BamB
MVRFRIYAAPAAFAIVSLACATLGGGPAGTPVPTLPAPVRWRVPALSSEIIPPVLADGLLVYETEQGQVIALDAASGQQKWNHALNLVNHVDRPLAVANGVVLVANQTVTETGKSQTSALGLDLHTGQPVWSQLLSPAADALFFYQPQANGGLAFFESETGPGGRQLTAADAATGQIQWQSAFSGTALAGDPAFAGDQIFVPIDHAPAPGSDRFTTDIVALAASTGARQWTTPLGALGVEILAAGGGRVFATAKDGTAWALAAATGQVNWKFQINDDAPSPPLLDGDTLYLGDSHGRFYALNAADGAQRWMAQLGQGVRSRAAVGGERIYVGSDDGNLNALDAATGIWKSQNELQHPFAASPYIPPQDTQPLYAKGTLYYFNVEDMIALQVP